MKAKDIEANEYMDVPVLPGKKFPRRSINISKSIISDLASNFRSKDSESLSPRKCKDLTNITNKMVENDFSLLLISAVGNG